jgi:hypothetical protein
MGPPETHERITGNTQTTMLQSDQPTVTLGDAVQIVHSKNAGPFEITLDVMLNNANVYNAIKDAECGHNIEAL